MTAYVSVILLLLSFVLLLGAGAATLETARRTDDRAAAADGERAEKAILERGAFLARSAIDWSAWDSTYRFAGDLSDAYVEENLGDETFEALRLNVLAVFDITGAPLHVAGYDLESREATEIAGAANIISDNPSLNLADGEPLKMAGVVELEGGRTLLVGAGSILPTDRESPSRGTLVMGRFLDANELALVKESTQIEVGIAETPDAQPTGDDGFSFVLERFTRTVRPLLDVEGRPIEQLQVRSGRDATSEALTQLAFLGMGVLGGVGAAIVAMYVGLRVILLKRLSKLDKVVGRIRTTGQPEPIDIDGSDELRTLSVNIASMVEALDQARTEVEQRVEERTAELRCALEDLEAETSVREAAERATYVSEARYRYLIENIADVVLTLSPDGFIGYASPSARHVLGWPPESLLGKSIGELLDSHSTELVLSWIGPGMTAGSAQLSLVAHRADGAQIDVELALTPLTGTGDVQGILRDVTARKQHEDELLHMASHDFLTGLCNRRRFEEELERELAEAARRGTHGAVIWIDLDGFKDVNDMLGHRAGDELLISIASRLSETLRAESLLARLGGDEFAVLLPHATQDDAVAATERLLREVGNIKVDFEDKTMWATCSAGIVLYPEHGLDVDGLLSRADMAMYRAKEMGPSHYRVFAESEHWRNDIEDRQTWTELVEMALNENMLAAFAQPITDAASGEVLSYELLVRIIDFEGAPIPPHRFLPVAERVGLIVDIDLWILAEAVRYLDAAPDKDFRINVNVSPRTLGDPRFRDSLDSLVTSSAIRPERLVIEITETAIIADVAGVKDVLEHIKRLGCCVALDDFGSGFTSFLHLKQLPIDDIKIDGSFITGLCENSNDQHLVRAIVEMARGLDKQTVAEFVESAEALEMLQAFGVDMAQGYEIGRPVPAEALMRSLSPAVVATSEQGR